MSQAKQNMSQIFVSPRPPRSANMLPSELSSDATSDSDYESLPSASFAGSDYMSFTSTACNNGDESLLSASSAGSDYKSFPSTPRNDGDKSLPNASCDYDDKSPSHEMSPGSPSLTSRAHFFTSVFDESESSSHALEYVLNHVFFPANHPKESDSTPENHRTLTSAVLAAARDYNSHIDSVHKPCWLRLIKTLENLLVVSECTHRMSMVMVMMDCERDREEDSDVVESGMEESDWEEEVYEGHIISQLGEMKVGGMFRFVMFLASLLREDRCPCISFRQKYGYTSEAGSLRSVRSSHRRPSCCTQGSQVTSSVRYRNT